jgi:hypothetical protein
MKTFRISIYCNLFFFIVISSQISAQKKIDDFISFQYYQKVAQAEFFWLTGDLKECYSLLADLDSTSGLIMGTWKELYSFAELCLMNKNYSKASECIYSLMANYGFSLDDIKSMHYFRNLKKTSIWKNQKNVLTHIENKFISDTMLYQELMLMLDDDQYYRKENDRIRICLKNDSTNADSLMKISSMNRTIIDNIDSVNYQKLLQIINTKGFPLTASITYHIRERQKIYTALAVMLIHFADSTKVSHLKPLLLQYIKQGDCPPELLANMLDTYQRMNNQLYLYGSYANTPIEKIFEFEKIDERIKEIGLPMYDLSKQIAEKRKVLMMPKQHPISKKTSKKN